MKTPPSLQAPESQIQLTGFPLSSCEDARVLILGSMPGNASLKALEYYAHPGNTFWRIMEELFGVCTNAPYPARLESLNKSGIALWDVVKQCVRPGSMDHSIQSDSVIVNDFPLFFETHPYVRAVFFNGSKAEALFNRLVLPGLPLREDSVSQKRLPSTSPAHASISYKEKLSSWMIIKTTLEYS